jgi:ATP-binding cassette subfamily B protein
VSGEDNQFSLFEGIRFLWQFARKFKRNFVLFYLGWLTQTLLESIMPIFLALMIDEVVYYRNTTFFLRISLIFVITALFACILYVVLYTIWSYLMSMYTFEIKSKVYRHAIHARASYLSGARMGDLMTLMFKDADHGMHLLVRNIIHFVNGSLRLVFYVLFVWLSNWKMGALMVVSLPLTLAVVRYFGRQTRKQSIVYRQAYGGYISWVLEALKGLREIRLLAAEKSSEIYFVKYFKEMIHVKIRTSIINLKASQFISMINLIVLISMYLLSGFLAVRGEITIGIFIAMMEYFSLANSQLKFLSENNMDMHNRLGNIKRIHDFLQVETEDAWPGTASLNIHSGEIRFSHVSFHYSDTKPILSDIHLHIRPGEHIAVVGTSGSGKTTMVNMILGFYEPKEGVISIDGTNIGETSLKSLRKQIGAVQQEVLMFEGTIRMNVSLGNPRASDEELWAACDHAAIGGFIRQLPDGLDTVIGKEGIELSGGQKQRLSIARIYLKNPKILIFDEATSALDNESEKIIHEAWQQISQGRTSITIAHRLSSIMSCDKVAVLHEGRIVSYDSHTKLFETCPYYQKLFKNENKSREEGVVC